MLFSVCAADRELNKDIPFPMREKSFRDCARVAELLGFDGIELGAYFEPPITTMHQPRDKMVTASVTKYLDETDFEDFVPQINLQGDLEQ